MSIAAKVVVVVAVAALATVPIVAVATPAPSGSTAASRTTVTHTTKHVVDPVTATGIKSGYTVTKKVAGKCWSDSDVITGAHRCMSHNLIYDPCWYDPADATRHTVVCFTDPTSKKLIKLHSSTKLPHYSGGAYTASDPWAMRLANHWLCVFADGARSEYRGKTENWVCIKNPGAHPTYLGAIYGSLHRGAQPWSGSVVEQTKAGNQKALGKIAVKSAYYGKVAIS
jgi:hypothetical protein